MLKEKKFQKRVEDFVCEHCGAHIKGSGYTNHCPECLWSKHVDINPGDRKEKCGGLMKPIGVKVKGEDYIIHHRCLKCGHLSKIKASPKDNFEKILKLASHPFKSPRK